MTRASKKSEDKTKKEVDAKALALADKTLDLVLKQINKTKKGEEKKIKIGRYGELKALNLPAIPTGSLALDTALGVGGVPRGRIVEIFGLESSGKTTLCLHIIAETQKEGGTAAFIDAEHSFSPEYAKKLSVNMNDLLISQPDDGSEAMEIVDMLARSGQLSLIVVDSVAGLVPRAEMEAEITDTHIGQQARLMSQALRRLATVCSKSDTTLIFTNQIRFKIGGYGNPETTPGGNALKHYTSQRLNIRRGAPIKEKDTTIGAETKIRVVKNKVAPPFRVAHFNIMYGTGIDREADVIATAASLGIVKQAGPWYSYDGERLGQGLENACACVKETPGLMEKIRKQVLEEIQ